MVTRVNPDLTRKLEAEILPLLTDYGRSQWNDLRFAGWKMLVVNQRRGRCYYRLKTVTVPLWTFAESKSDGYRAWYLGHEIAHAIAGGSANHGPAFMAQLKQVVPVAWVHYEYGYKPRNAAAAGVPQADGTIPQKAPRAARTSSHPQSVINAKNLHLRNCLGVWLEYVREQKRWVLRDQTNGYAYVASEIFAAATVEQLERMATKVLADWRAKRGLN